MEKRTKGVRKKKKVGTQKVPLGTFVGEQEQYGAEKLSILSMIEEKGVDNGEIEKASGSS